VSSFLQIDHYKKSRSLIYLLGFNFRKMLSVFLFAAFIQLSIAGRDPILGQGKRLIKT